MLEDPGFTALWIGFTLMMSFLFLSNIEQNDTLLWQALGAIINPLLGSVPLVAVLRLFGCFATSPYGLDVVMYVFSNAVSGVVFALPAAFAKSRNKKNRVAITALNFLLGFTFVGWVVALVWALTEDA